MDDLSNSQNTDMPTLQDGSGNRRSGIRLVVALVVVVSVIAVLVLWLAREAFRAHTGASSTSAPTVPALSRQQPDPTVSMPPASPSPTYAEHHETDDPYHGDEDAIRDTDGDGVINAIDNCLHDSNSDQEDGDDDGDGNACDRDDDGDSVPDVSDNCPNTANHNQADADSDGEGDACDPLMQ